MIMHTGYDGTAEEIHFQGAAAGAERGYNVLVFDGPGQGSLIRRQGMLFRPDWENVVGPVIDYALTLPGVDSGPDRAVGPEHGRAAGPAGRRLRAPAGRTGRRQRRLRHGPDRAVRRRRRP